MSLKASFIQNVTFLKGSGSSALVKGQHLFLADIYATENKGKIVVIQNKVILMLKKVNLLYCSRVMGKQQST